MIDINKWAIRHHVSDEALLELKQAIGILDQVPAPNITTEAEAQNVVRLRATEAGARLWRNNVGVLKDERGVPVRFGLCNDSSALNRILKSSDLIGISSTGQFLAREVKRPGWTYKGTDREIAQLNFINLINTLGGDAKFTTGDF